MSGIISLADRRARRTRAAIVTAFNELLFVKDYDDITPGEVAERADVGRSTFYEHYSGKNDVLAQSLAGILRPIARAGLATDPEPALATVLEHFWTNRRLARTMLAGGPRPMMNGLLRDLIAEEIADAPHAGGGVPTFLLATHLAHGHLALIEEWLTGRHGCPAQRLAETLHSIAHALLRRSSEG
jgi:AcrR family transcriptional regulator